MTANNMRVLNLDLDFFLNDLVHNRADDPSSRPDKHGLVAWSADQVVEFLEEVLKLTEPRPGKVVVSHHEVFFEWRSLIKQGMLKTPFFISHVDAHSDLGLGFPSWVYLHSKFLELSLQERAFPQEGEEGLNFGSFMSFAIGNRWFSEIDFIVPPFWRDDIGQYSLVDASLTREMLKPNCQVGIQLMYAPREKIDASLIRAKHFTEIRQDIGEPVVPLNIVSQASATGRYEGKHWDYVFLSHSPGYVPTSADPLLKVISAYIDTHD